MDALKQLERDNERRAFEYWRTIPRDVTVLQAVAMPYSGERNLALRKALGIGLRSGAVVAVNPGDVVQVVVAKRPRAEGVRNILADELGDGWTVEIHKRPDRRHIVTAYRDPGDGPA